MTTPVEFAKQLAAWGFCVLPAPYQKKAPVIPWKPYQDPANRPSNGDLDALFAGPVLSNFWLLQGRASRSVCGDCDNEPTIAWLYGLIGAEILDATPQVKTAKGRHFHFRIGADEIVESWSLHDGDVQFDFRAEGTGVVAPPSIHANGTVYKWLRSPDEGWQPLPDALRRAPAAAKDVSAAPGENGNPGGLAALLALPASEGSRNEWLTKVAGHYAKQHEFKDGYLETVQMANAKCKPPLPDAEWHKLAASIWKAERSNPAGNKVDDAPALVYEAAHAAVLRDEWRGLYRWAAHEGSWRQWTGAVWEKADEATVVAAAQKVLRRHYGQLLALPQTKEEDKRLRTLHGASCRYASVVAGLAFLRGEAGFHTAVAEWDAEPYALNCADGLLDLRTRKLRPHDPAVLCTKITRWTFGAGQSSGAWSRHLERCLPDADIRRQVQRDLGRALVGADLEESLPIWYGTGANGKSTTADALQQGIRGYAKQAVANLLVAQRFENHPTEIAALVGSRVVFSDEIGKGKRLDEVRVKKLTGGGPPEQGRFMRGDFFDVPHTFSIFLLVNWRPVITGTDQGIWRRIRLVPWTFEIPLTEQRPQDQMVAELVEDGAWMLRWMVDGFADWQADPHWVADAVKVATKNYRAEQDILAGFVDRCCGTSPRLTVAVEALYQAYTQDHAENVADDSEPLGKIAFGKRLVDQGFTKKQLGHDKVHTWLGIGLRGDANQSERLYC
jgi:putative DNA primase/helicase